MIIAEQKPIPEIAAQVRQCRKVLVLGCGGCVTVCQAGGEKEAEILASALRLMGVREGWDTAFDSMAITRQCDPEYLDGIARKVAEYDCVLSLGCGVGVNFLAERFPRTWVVPGLNTKGAGATLEAGVWEERCLACGDCILHLTGGICPIVRCSKSLLNGPCGGSQGGKCEISPDVACGWQLIYDRLKQLDRLDLLLEVREPKDWSRTHDGGLRRVVKEEARL
ncbi:MAG: methylenetetrahydrofolate reductase C-terminal domain-containing protein [Firmicutes bacterium]|nr:methylenetetrahydrofolate reductase C-terminal domain-containing protein [Bacillota bacterium]